MATTVKAWTVGEKGAPPFPEDFEIVKKAVLQVTDIKTNHNKYYAIELHRAKAKGKERFRIFTHYGRTDDLETNPDAGQKECRYFATLAEAEANYDSIYREKTSARKGYKEVALASTKIGSQKLRGSSVGQLDAKTVAKIKGKNGVVAVRKVSKLPQAVQDLVRYLYDEAKSALTSTVAANITAQGIETPLGVLTVGQVEKGEKILLDVYAEVKKNKNRARLEALSSDFYTAVPHRVGRSRTAIAAAVIDNLTAIHQKQDTLQLMKDMLQVNGEAGNVLYNARVDQEYDALQSRIEPLAPSDPDYKEMERHVVKSQVKTKSIKVRSIFRVRRENEWKSFAQHVGNHKMLFHGSRVQNWVGILSRGILLPKIVVSMGVNRTDEGWLGSGIYFGDASCTSAFYTSPGKKKTRFLAIVRVALGKQKKYHEITYGLKKPPAGFDSCHGVRCTDKVESEFDDDEFVIYTAEQQRQEYLVEFTM
jgi:poly [ADP-ribose] polymerase